MCGQCNREWERGQRLCLSVHCGSLWHQEWECGVLSAFPHWWLTHRYGLNTAAVHWEDVAILFFWIPKLVIFQKCVKKWPDIKCKMHLQSLMHLKTSLLSLWHTPLATHLLCGGTQVSLLYNFILYSKFLFLSLLKTIPTSLKETNFSWVKHIVTYQTYSGMQIAFCGCYQKRLELLVYMVCMSCHI